MCSYNKRTAHARMHTHSCTYAHIHTHTHKCAHTQACTIWTGTFPKKIDKNFCYPYYQVHTNQDHRETVSHTHCHGEMAMVVPRKQKHQSLVTAPEDVKLYPPQKQCGSLQKAKHRAACQTARTSIQKKWKQQIGINPNVYQQLKLYTKSGVYMTVYWP